MKKKVLSSYVVVVMLVGYLNAHLNLKECNISQLTLLNVEALANNENAGGEYIGCYSQYSTYSGTGSYTQVTVCSPCGSKVKCRYSSDYSGLTTCRIN